MQISDFLTPPNSEKNCNLFVEFANGLNTEEIQVLSVNLTGKAHDLSDLTGEDALPETRALANRFVARLDRVSANASVANLEITYPGYKAKDMENLLVLINNKATELGGALVGPKEQDVKDKN